jgi:adsorption protein B
MTFPDALAIVLLCTKALLALVGVVFLVSGSDDLFIDLYHLARATYRRLFVVRNAAPLSVDRLCDKPEQPIAVMLPAWDESAVIRRMLEANLERICYRNLHVFVGTYPNDPATHLEVERVRERYANVHRVVCPKDGPTNKADCLNWIHQGIRLFEKEHGIRFEAFVLNDSEDVIHPLCFKLFNYFIPRLDMIQVPVIPFEAPWWHFTSGHYLDEFAENHGKDMVVRESLAGGIPGAGVGCAFSRHAIEVASEASNNELFSPASLAEDYDFGMQLRVHHLKQAFVRVAIEGADHRPEYIAVREYFPSSFKAAMRQKARWIVGISLQGWRRLGWRGDWRMKYALIRDRKGLVTNPAVALGYCAVLAIVSIWIGQWLEPDFYRFPPIVERGSWLWYLTVANACFLCLRLIQRCRFVWQLHGWREALLAVPRQVWGNVVNVAAVSRAFYLFGRSLRTGRSVAWDKTAHRFPSEAVLTNIRRRLGDLLLDRGLLTVAQLDTALQRQQHRGRKLGTILAELGFVAEDQVVQALGRQQNLAVRPVDPYSVPLDVIRRFPRPIAIRHSMFPLEDDGESIVAAAIEPIGEERRVQLESLLSRRLVICLASESDVAFALRRGYERLSAPEARLPLGEHLVASGLLSHDQLSEALRRQRRSYVRLGAILDELGLVGTEALADTLASFDVDRMRLGDVMVAARRLAPEQLEYALNVQRTRFLPLARVLIEAGMASREALEDRLREVCCAA